MLPLPVTTASDWLVDTITTPAVVLPWQGPAADPIFKAVQLSNGLIARAFSTVPNWATVDFRCKMKYSSYSEQMRLLPIYQPRSLPLYVSPHHLAHTPPSLPLSSLDF